MEGQIKKLIEELSDDVMLKIDEEILDRGLVEKEDCRDFTLEGRQLRKTLIEGVINNLK